MKPFLCTTLYRGCFLTKLPTAAKIRCCFSPLVHRMDYTQKATLLNEVA